MEGKAGWDDDSESVERSQDARSGKGTADSSKKVIAVVCRILDGRLIHTPVATSMRSIRRQAGVIILKTVRLVGGIMECRHERLTAIKCASDVEEDAMMLSKVVRT